MPEFDSELHSESVLPLAESSSGEALTVERANDLVAQAIANLHHEDLSLRYYAAWWLGKFRVREPTAVAALIAALEDDDDRTELGGYPLRRNAARALGKLGDWRAVPGLVQSLACSDFYVREAAAQSLGMLGDPACIPVLVQFLAGGVAAAQLVPGRPHLVQPTEAVIEALGTLGATQAIPLIQPFLDHPVEQVQYATARAMYVLTGESIHGERLLQALAGNNLQLRRAALADLGASGYLPAAEAIANAAVENGFKLIALKGLLDNHLHRSGIAPLSSAAQQVMTLMDMLL